MLFHLQCKCYMMNTLQWAEKIFVLIVYYIFINICLFSTHFLLNSVIPFLKMVKTTIECWKVFHAMIFGKLERFFFYQRPTNGYFLSMRILNHSTESDSKIEKSLAFIDFPIFSDFLTHSVDAFSISSVCFTIIANVDVEIPSLFAKVFCGPILLSNSCKIVSFSLNRKHLRFQQSYVLLHKFSKSTVL